MPIPGIGPPGWSPPMPGGKLMIPTHRILQRDTNQFSKLSSFSQSLRVFARDLNSEKMQNDTCGGHDVSYVFTIVDPTYVNTIVTVLIDYWKETIEGKRDQLT
jgi:hypothetical protein